MTFEMKKNIRESEIKNIMARAWGINPSEVPSEARFNDLPQWDSLGHVTLLVALEVEYKIGINYQTVTRLTSIPAIMEYLREERDA